jgi:hypothetical protein
LSFVVVIHANINKRGEWNVRDDHRPKQQQLARDYMKKTSTKQQQAHLGAGVVSGDLFVR